MATEAQRQERRTLKQKLFAIRRHIEGEDVKLNKELKELKAQYEAIPGFTSWSGFPEKWDIGDPYEVKQGVWGNEVDQRNFERAFGKSYNEIVFKEQQPEPMMIKKGKK